MSENEQVVAHPVPVKLLMGVFAALLVLTAATLAVTYMDLGALNVWVALLIAVAKAGLVALFFMHLWWDSPYNGIVLIVGLLFVAMFVGLATLDTSHYQQDLEPPPGIQVQQ